jgi:N-acetylneuraminate synthase
MIQIGNKQVGPGQPTYVIGEIGINHNGDLDLALELIGMAADAGCDAVKFQKRTPDLCVPAAQRNIMRETPWGMMSYQAYKHRIEFGQTEYEAIAAHSKSLNIDWFASCWDEPSVDFIEAFEPVCYKMASASLTDEPLLRKIDALGRPVILSTGMSTMDEIHRATRCLTPSRLLIAHATSAYPCKPELLNLRMIHTLQRQFGLGIGYSGHETGLQTTVAAVAMGACFVERHITLDRAMWGSDQAASVEPAGLKRLVRDIRVIDRALGDGIKRVYDEELPIRAKLRRNPGYLALQSAK